ncbi:MAG: class I SAM-dependent methyltransferase [Candidatus Nanohaloarchaea archaeon]
MIGKDQFRGWAKYYDYIYSEEGEDTQFYLDEVKNVDGRILEIGCGTGRMYLEVLEHGSDIYGFDISSEMLDKLRRKAEKRGLKPEVKQAKMENFSYDKKFDLITIPFNTFLHNLTVDEQVLTLKNCKKHLKDNGRLILDFYLPDFQKVVEGIGEESGSTEKIDVEGEEYRREVEVVWESKVEQIRTVENKLYNPKGEVVWKNKFKTKLVSKREFELLLKLVGFTDWNVYQGFDREEVKKPKITVWEIEK